MLRISPSLRFIFPLASKEFSTRDCIGLGNSLFLKKEKKELLILDLSMSQEMFKSRNFLSRG
jgi:hypothetical protein